jgi:hypothetical protein
LFTLKEKSQNFPNGIPATTLGENLTDFVAFENTDKQLFRLKDLELALKLS